MTDAPAAPASSSTTTPMSVRLGIGSAIFQGLLVVVGVVLGFLVTEWQADSSRRADAAHALAGILEEIAANRDSVAAARAYHSEKMEAIEAAARGGKAPDIREFNRGFVSPAQVSSAAWTTAGETGALANLPFDQVLSLSRIYSQQAAYVQQQGAVSAVIYPELFEHGPQGVVDHALGLRSILTTLHFREQQLEEAYARTLSEIGAD